MTRVLLCIAALACLLAAPAAAFGQAAGDEQYQDPFGDEPAQQEPAPTATPAPSQPAPEEAAPAPTAAPAPAQAAPAQAAPAPASSSEQLPRTGADAGWLALAGSVLLATGLALRRRADLQR